MPFDPIATAPAADQGPMGNAVRGLGQEGGISQSSVDKILEDNPKRLYALN